VGSRVRVPPPLPFCSFELLILGLKIESSSLERVARARDVTLGEIISELIKWRVFTGLTSVFLPALAFVFVSGVLPGVMQDEYIYSMQSRYGDLASTDYPTYLFSLVYQSTSLCGDSFYVCGKLVNAGFLVVSTASLIAITGVIFSGKHRYLIATIVAIGPMGVYVSFFMPETMFFAINLLALAILVTQANRQGHTALVLVSLLLAAALLVKRHEIFLLPAFAGAIFVFLQPSRQKWAAKLALAGFIGIALPIILRTIAGFLLTGPQSLKLFGSTYENRIETFDQRATQTLSESRYQSTPEFLLGTFFETYIGHLSVLFIFGAYLLAFLTPRFLIGNRERDQSASPLQVLVVFTMTILSTLPLVVSAFTTFLTVSGANHDGRLVFRYFEFVFPLLLISVIGLAKAGLPEISSRSRYLIFFTSIPALVFVVWQFLAKPITPLFSDSPHVVALLGKGWTIGLAATIAGSMVFALRPWITGAISAKQHMVAVIMLGLLSGIGGWMNLDSEIGRSPAFFDVAGRETHQALADDDKARVLVVGGSRQQVFTAMFWIDRPDSTFALYPPGATLESKHLKSVSHILLLTPVEVPGTVTILEQSSQYVLLEVTK
jgi:phosphoglycerol transferase